MEQLSNVLINVEADEHFLETMHFQLIATNEASLCKPTTNFCSLIALKLQDFTVLGMFNYSSVASKLLKKTSKFIVKNCNFGALHTKNKMFRIICQGGQLIKDTNSGFLAESTDSLGTALD